MHLMLPVRKQATSNNNKNKITEALLSVMFFLSFVL